MKELEVKIRKRCIDYTQIEVSPKGYIYAHTVPNGTKYYEVFKRVEYAPHHKQKSLSKHASWVLFPGDEAFGKWAWCCRTLEKAQERLNNF